MSRERPLADLNVVIGLQAFFVTVRFELITAGYERKSLAENGLS